VGSTNGRVVMAPVQADPIRRFDTFLCHNSEDKSAVIRISRQLRKNGVLPWLDEWELRPGVPWQRTLEAEISIIPSAVVFIGASGVGPWQRLEYEAFLREFVSRGCPVVPVILPNAPSIPQLPVFLRGMMWVDFRKARPNPFRQLIWGIYWETDGLAVRSCALVNRRITSRTTKLPAQNSSSLILPCV
jgi:hypothetical protein